MAATIVKCLSTVLLLMLLAVAVVLGVAWTGLYNVAADQPHHGAIDALLQTVRERAIAARVDDLQVPDLRDPARIRQGAGNYDAMCMGCHLAPGMDATELSRGLKPAPPNLSRTRVDAAAAFWTIKHGITFTGMPAWGRSMEDEYLWNLTAFVQRLPHLDAAQYQALVDSSGGHEHGGGETRPHDHDASASGAEPDAAVEPPAASTPATIEHRHADGTVESHPVPQSLPIDAEPAHRH